ncbi:hypothetical protein ACQ859_19090 [Roseateles chitinivorans]|uniref:hypothetical protein n=1 Tax=Roseateles chitinivorans TaxID=2917965 RepID=UPI003D672E74
MAATPDRPDPRRIPDVPDPGGAAESIEALTLRIEMAELRVVRRDLEFQLHWDSLQQRGKAVMVPSRWLLPALGTGASWLFWRLVRGRRRRHERHRHDESHARAFHASRDARAAHGAHRGDHAETGTDRADMGSMQLLTLLWSLMPTQIRGRVGPEITQLVLGVIAGFMQGRKKQREETREDAR